jgi:hypothetical protein
MTTYQVSNKGYWRKEDIYDDQDEGSRTSTEIKATVPAREVEVTTIMPKAIAVTAVKEDTGLVAVEQEVEGGAKCTSIAIFSPCAQVAKRKHYA